MYKEIIEHLLLGVSDRKQEIETDIIYYIKRQKEIVCICACARKRESEREKDIDLITNMWLWNAIGIVLHLVFLTKQNIKTILYPRRTVDILSRNPC